MSWQVQKRGNSPLISAMPPQALARDPEDFPSDSKDALLASSPSAQRAEGSSAVAVLAGYSRTAIVAMALTLLTSSQGLLIAASKRQGGFTYAPTSANILVEILKAALSLGSLSVIWAQSGVTEDTTLATTWQEIHVFPIPALLYLVKNLLQYYIFLFVDAPSYQVLKNLNIISTGVLYRIFLNQPLNSIQWSALILLALGCTEAQTNANSDNVLTTSSMGMMLAIIMALLSGAAGVYTELIIKKTPQRSIHVQNFYLYSFGIIFNLVTILSYDLKAIEVNGFFHGFDLTVWVMIVNHALSGLAVSMVMKYADNIVKVYSTSVAMLVTTIISVPLLGFKLTLPFVLGSMVVTVATFLNYKAKSLREIEQ